MRDSREILDAHERWQKHCLYVHAITKRGDSDINETPNQKRIRIKRLLGNYAQFCEYYFPHYLTKTVETADGIKEEICHNAKFHNEAARELLAHRTYRAVYMWPRGHAKSTHLGIFIPCYLMFQATRQINVGVLVNKSEQGAVTLLADLQAELEFNQRLIADFGTQRTQGSWESGKFITSGGVAWFALGRGQSPRGLRKGEHRPDYILLDDFDDDELSRNESRVATATDWIKTALFGSLNVGQGRFIMVGNGFAKCMALRNIAAMDSVHLSMVTASDSKGDPVWADKWTRQQMEDYADFCGYRAWQSEMMHNPITEGGIIKWEWIRWCKVLPLHKYDQIICYTDPSFKSTQKNDYKACRVWGANGNERHLLDCFVRQATVGDMVRWLYNYYEALPENVAVNFFMEANFMQDILLDEFVAEGNLRGYQLPIMADKRSKPDKLARIEAMSPLWERGFIYYNEALRSNIDMQTGIDQTLALAHGSSAHDDAPDADEGALWLLQRSQRASRFAPSFGTRPRPKNIW